MKKATFGAGCFWCVEAIFQELKGVESVKSGYTGGRIKNPSYKKVCSGRTGHAEVAQIGFDPELISYEELIEVFFATHDPTTLDKQGNDVGTQYRSGIFAHDREQFYIAEKAIQAASESGTWPNPVVTQLSMIGDFYPAETVHDNYFSENGDQGYCEFVIRPKVDKFKKLFADKLKD